MTKRGREGLRFPGLGDRLRGLISARGGVVKFLADHPRPEYREVYFYAWFKTRVPSFEAMTALSDDTGVPLSYLLLGQRAIEEARVLLDMAPALLSEGSDARTVPDLVRPRAADSAAPGAVTAGAYGTKFRAKSAAAKKRGRRIS